ncbi:MAG: hypothetical protein WEB53_07755 [Akkermansiaceae bacterium]
MKTHSIWSILALLSVAGALRGDPTADSLNDGLILEHDPVEDSSLLSWWGIEDRFYFIQQSEDLVTWAFMPIFEVGFDEVISWGFRSNTSKLFFRALHTADIDSDLMQADYDHDGLTTHQEWLLESHPFNPDTSGDGIFDGIAHKLGLPVTPPEIPEPDPMDTTPPAITLIQPETAILLP